MLIVISMFVCSSTNVAQRFKNLLITITEHSMKSCWFLRDLIIWPNVRCSRRCIYMYIVATASEHDFMMEHFWALKSDEKPTEIISKNNNYKINAKKKIIIIIVNDKYHGHSMLQMAFSQLDNYT